MNERERTRVDCRNKCVSFFVGSIRFQNTEVNVHGLKH
jgi:hypothetical protein